MDKKYFKKKSKQVFKKRYKKLNIDRRVLFILLLGVLLSFLFKQIIFVAIFSAINALLLSIERRTGISQDIEFSTFSCVLFTRAYGLKWGIFMAFFTKLVANIYNSNFRVDHLFMIVGYAIASIITFLLPGTNIMWIGFIVTIIVNIYIFFVSKYITFLSMFEIVMYGSSNVIFNLLVFSILSNPVLGLMTVF
jgi:hypothetical protein